MPSLKNRINQLMIRYNLNQHTFEEKVGIPDGSLSRFLNGKRSLSKKSLSKICQIFNVSPAWLQGEGEMPVREELRDLLDAIRETNRLGDLIVKQIIDSYDEEWEDLMKKLMLISTDKRKFQLVMELIDTLYQKMIPTKEEAKEEIKEIMYVPATEEMEHALNKRIREMQKKNKSKNILSLENYKEDT